MISSAISLARRYFRALCVTASIVGLVGPAVAQQAGTDDAASGAPSLAITLDSLAQVDGACRLTFVARNGLAADAEALVVEAVAFNADGGVARIALFDFGGLPADRTRVRQFDLGEMACDAVGAVLVNGVQSCEGPADCAQALSVSSRADGVDLMQ